MSMSSLVPTEAILNARIAKLSKFYNGFLSGQRSLKSSREGELFIEAVCVQSDKAACINKLTSNAGGLLSVQACMRFNVSPTFLNGPAARLLTYFQEPALKVICEGDTLYQIILHIVEPPIFWNAFVQAFRDNNLDLPAQQAFAWLLLELISFSGHKAVEYINVANDFVIQSRLLDSTEFQIRTLGQKIKNILSLINSPTLLNDDENRPGGRHDNDFSNFREISILPTADELTSTEEPFLRKAQAVEDSATETSRMAVHIDNQFRLLREDMLGEIREELRIVLGKKSGRHRGIIVKGFNIIGVDCGIPRKRHPWAIQLQCHSDIGQIFSTKIEAKDRKAHLSNNRNVFKHQSLACLILDGEVIAFPTINRDDELLAEDPPVLLLQFQGEASTTKALLGLKTSKNAILVQMDTAVFAFEPVLKRLQEIKEIPLEEDLMFWSQSCSVQPPPAIPIDIVDKIKANPLNDLKDLLEIQKPVKLDEAQSTSLLMGLTQSISLIQGPPGTGKSFIGALITKVLHDFTSKVILIVCYTNHALDQFLEDLLDIGIPGKNMVRLGGKSTARTKPLSLYDQSSDFKFGKNDWDVIDTLKEEAARLEDHLREAFLRFYSTKATNDKLMEHLEFEDSVFHEAFIVPDLNGEMTRVGKKGKSVDQYYLLDRWIHGKDPGSYKNRVTEESCHVWNMLHPARKAAVTRWTLEIFKTEASAIYNIAERFNKCQEKLDRKLSTRNLRIIADKRIIACTTTAAAKYIREVQAASPHVLLVEEAGEILESHILTALGAETKQLILIGDHQQLRPKVNNYTLSVENGDGYDLNRSLFERLVLRRFPHQTLTEQHRMRPEIAGLIRHLTYPGLKDAPTTQNRPHLRGFLSDVVFVNHSYLEDENPKVNDQTNKWGSSKQNTHEAKMVLKCVKYLGQNGYGTDQIVVLTPYLAQLHLLREILSTENDPVLNDLDSYDLVKAGLMPAATAKLLKKPIRISSIDNYQGEESRIVIATMTRSNAINDIGFMAAPERLNVLLSRARDGLIMIGNAETFLNTRNNKHTWTDFFGLLKKGRHVYDGFPVKCERHPDQQALLQKPEDFDTECSDGGCKQPCRTILQCGIHPCPERCHQLYDHSKILCFYQITSNCPVGHIKQWKCFQTPPLVCARCELDARVKARKQKREFEQQQRRDEEHRKHLEEIANLDEKIESERQELRDAQLRREREQAIEQKKKDLAETTTLTKRMMSSAISVAKSLFSPDSITHATPGESPTTNSSTGFVPASSPDRDKGSSDPSQQSLIPQSSSPSEEEWKRQKDIENVQNDAIDAIMNMVGLEDVKGQVLRIKGKIETTIRQGTNMKDERLGVVMLGNPGTGKTTVARLYAKFLTSMAVLPGNAFVETTGSRLANEGIAKAQKHIEDITNAGGGAFFLDEAYQLTEEQNYGGKQVLDFLLAEIENNVGKIVFILAGYSKQMEKFFEHNPGLSSRLPHRLQFTDYTDNELLRMLRLQIEKKYDEKMKIADGANGLYMRIVIARLGRGRGREGFGNARALQNIFSKISERQGERLARERRSGGAADDFLLSKEDLIGPDPSKAYRESAAWKELQKLIGLETVKETVQSMIDRIELNYRRELEEKKPLQVSLNRVFLGSPGTGKTTVAKLYGQVLADLGLLSSGEVVVKNPSDFIGSALGQSESQTKAILATTVGKVLIIDEAYMLYSGGSGSGNQSDTYRTAVIDTMVAEIQSVPGEDRCVLLLGYNDQIKEMFQNVNAGLERRFAIDDAFYFQDFTSAQLRQVLDLKLKDQALSATDEAKDVAVEILNRARRRPNFGNAGEVENLLTKAKGRYQARQSQVPSAKRSTDVKFEPQDFDAEFDRGDHAAMNIRKLFEDVVGCEEIVGKLEGYQKIASGMKAHGLDPYEQIPTNFVFKGPPGTGKTTTARKMGQIYYDMGFLSVPEVIECSATDLVGQYVGQTGPKTQGQLEKALGKVLFVDEAYRLGEGPFASEAVNELVDQLTKPKFAGKLIVILAGYDDDMNRLLAINAGLSSRFPEEIVFSNMQPESCLQLLSQELRRRNLIIPELHEAESLLQTQMYELFEKLSGLTSWGNARDIKTLAKSMIGAVYRDNTSKSPDLPLVLSPEEMIKCVQSMLKDRQSRSDYKKDRNASPSPLTDMSQFLESLPPTSLPPPPSTTTTTTRTATKKRPPPSQTEKKVQKPLPKTNVEHSSKNPTRDPGVSDAIWQQLQEDKAANERAQSLLQEKIKSHAKVARNAQAAEKQLAATARALAETKARDNAHAEELKRQREEARLKELRARLAKEKAERELEAKRREEREKKQKEEQAQKKLREMGVCSAGFRWIQTGGGYRCAGGSHFVSNVELGV